MPIAFDRGICCDLNETISREWLVTNGMGSYAAGTVAGVLTRMQHGLLVTSPKDAASPQLLLAKFDEELVFDERKYYLGTNEYLDGTLNPAGFVHLETFRLEEGFPVFTYHLGGIDGIVLEKRIWMTRGYNTTYIQYRLLRTAEAGNYRQANEQGSQRRSTEEQPGKGFVRYQGYPAYPEAAQRILSLTLLPFAAFRPHYQPQYGNNDWHFKVQVHSNNEHQPYSEHATPDDEQGTSLPLPNGVVGCSIRAWDGAPPYSIFAVGHPDSQPSFIPTGVWYWHFLRRHDQAAGRPAVDDLYLPGVIKAKLWPGEDSVLTIIVTAEELSSLTFSQDLLNLSYKRSIGEQNQLVNSILQPQRYFGEGGETSHYPRLLSLPPARDTSITSEEFLRLLIQAADRFLVRRALPLDDTAAKQSLFSRTIDEVPVILSDYFSLEDHTRDALIALPGLTLATKRFDEARLILRCYARYFKQGMLPDRLPSAAHPLQACGYGSVDTTLWYFYALDHYIRVTHDYQLLDELYPRLVESINWYIQGTDNGIQVDSTDGLLKAIQPGKALTWMNASVDGTPITPRHGKPVEVNALWFHTLSLMYEWSQRQQQKSSFSNGHTPAYYQQQAALCKDHFQQRFWYAEGGYLYDTIDGPGGDDHSLRPNQLLALSLRYTMLATELRHTIFELVTQQLLTPMGLRTLAPPDHSTPNNEDHHQLTEQVEIVPWLIGPYIDAMLSMQDSLPSHSTARQASENSQKNDSWQRTIAILEAFRVQFNTGLLGMIGELHESDTLQQGEKVASVRSIAELLRVYDLLVHKQISYPLDLVSSERAHATSLSAARDRVLRVPLA
jgi:glycogen debranching enzyme